MQDSKTISGSIVHIKDGAEADARELLVDINPVQSGSGTPSPSNVRPITGWDDVSVYVTGVNIFDEQTFVSMCSAVKQSDGTYYISNLNFAYGKKIWNNPTGYEGQLTITFIRKQTSSGAGLRWKVYYTDGTNESIGNANQDADIFTTYTLVTNASKVVDYILGDYSSNRATYCNIQIELGTTATAYEPYNGTTTTTTLPSTTYGGTIDLVSGVLTVDTKNYTISGTEPDSSYIKGGGSGSYMYGFKVSDSLVNDSESSDKFNHASKSWTNFQIGECELYNNTFYMYIPNGSSIADAKAYIQSLGGVQMMAKLATPTTAQLTGQQIELLRDCYVWADAGDITLTYETELLDGRFRKIKVNDNSIIAPNNFELEREDVYTAEYTTCTGKLIADKIGWKYADTTMQWDTLPDDMLAILTGTTGAFTLKFTDSDGSHTENVIRLGVRNTATRFTDDFGNALWRNIELEVSFTNVH